MSTAISSASTVQIVAAIPVRRGPRRGCRPRLHRQTRPSRPLGRDAHGLPFATPIWSYPRRYPTVTSRHRTPGGWCSRSRTSGCWEIQNRSRRPIRAAQNFAANGQVTLDPLLDSLHQDLRALLGMKPEPRSRIVPSVEPPDAKPSRGRA